MGCQGRAARLVNRAGEDRGVGWVSTWIGDLKVGGGVEPAFQQPPFASVPGIPLLFWHKTYCGQSFIWHPQVPPPDSFSFWFDFLI